MATFEFRMNDQCLQVLDPLAIVLILIDEYRLRTKYVDTILELQCY